MELSEVKSHFLILSLAKRSEFILQLEGLLETDGSADASYHGRKRVVNKQRTCPIAVMANMSGLGGKAAHNVTNAMAI